MKTNLVLVALVVFAIAGGILLLRRQQASTSESVPTATMSAGCAEVKKAFADHDNGEWVTMSGTVTELFPDQIGASRHQRFILRCPLGQTVLIVNNVDVGQRVPVFPGARVAVHGRYVWNSQGGLVHDTHHSGAGGTGGWILLGGRVYAWTKVWTKRWIISFQGGEPVDGHNSGDPRSLLPVA